MIYTLSFLAIVALLCLTIRPFSNWAVKHKSKGSVQYTFVIWSFIVGGVIFHPISKLGRQDVPPDFEWQILAITVVALSYLLNEVRRWVVERYR